MHVSKFRSLLMVFCLISLLTLLGCATQFNGSGNAPQQPLNQEFFFSAIDAAIMEVAEARLWASLGECGDIGGLSVLSEDGLQGSAAMQNAAQQVNRQLNTMGSNTYAVQSYEWLPSGQVAVNINVLICSD